MGILTESTIFDLMVIVTTTIVTVIAYLKWKLSSWDRVGLPTLSPSLPFGDAKEALLGRTTFGEHFREIYRKFKSRGLKHGGIYVGIRPGYMPIDPEIIKHIMQKDFEHFVNHGNFSDPKGDPLRRHLFNLEGTKWRNMRVKLTPTFTSRKIKMMFQTLADCSVGLKDIMNDAAKNGTAVEIKDVFGRFTTDIIGSCAFGIECNSLKNPDAEFRKYGKKGFEVKLFVRMKIFLQFAVPYSVLQAIGLKITDPEVEQFFMKAIKDIVEYREKNNVYRKDFMHLLLQLKNRGKVEDDIEHVIDEHGRVEEKALTMNELAAECFGFFLASFETTSTTMTFALYEIATNLDVQDNLRREINAVLEKHGDKLSYDAIMEMTYMDNVLSETLRKHPPIRLLRRVCTKDYTIPNTNIHLKKGTNVSISVLALHTDPDYFPNPEKFDPDRFLEENKSKRPACTWIPFGEGPRLCIGLRFGLMQSKVGLTTLLRNYKITLSQKTKMPLTLDKKILVATVEGGVWIEVEKLD